MLARELYEKSVIMRDGKCDTPFETRALFTARRAGYCIIDANGNHSYNIDIDILERALMDGTAWAVRNAGKKTIELWCKWVTGERAIPSFRG